MTPDASPTSRGGGGFLGATALAAAVTGPSHSCSERQCAAWPGLTPLDKSSSGEERLGRNSKGGDQYPRRLLVTGSEGLREARSVQKSAAVATVSMSSRRRSYGKDNLMVSPSNTAILFDIK
ncbi:transposase [Methylobacterium mesophilicum]|uniref:transposase n=1 Tax=Methylobacterium mesophilicum TaxID=39956 RepID=UPI003D7AB9FF